MMDLRKTTKEFIEEANKLHNNKFDYSKTIYKTQKDKVTIICPIHGEFNQLPRNHIRNKGTSNNYGCRKCGIEERTKNKFISHEDLIKSFRKIHSNEYDYSNIDYKGNHKKIEIYCKKCKKYFSQIPSVHKRGGRCKFCLAKEGKYNFKLTQEEWIKRAKKKHHSKYDYSKVVYRGGHEKVIIICKKHGEFKKSAQDHIGIATKGGCPKCLGHYRTTEEAILEFKKVHGDKYDYSKFKYNGSRKKGIVICNKTNTHSQKLKNMIIGLINNEDKYNPIYDSEIKEVINKKLKLEYGRSHYTYERLKIGIPRASERRINQQSDLFKTKEIKKYKIIKKEIHGEFEIDYIHHIRGHGCPICKSHGYNLGQKGFLYINIVYSGSKKGIKIGITNRFEDRIHELNTKNIKANGIVTNLCYFVGDGKVVYNAEKFLKKKYSKKLGYFTKKEFPDGYQETMKYDDNLIDNIAEDIKKKYKKINMIIDESDSNYDKFLNKYLNY